MGRRKVHVTEEQRLAAGRERSSTYYHSYDVLIYWNIEVALKLFGHAEKRKSYPKGGVSNMPLRRRKGRKKAHASQMAEDIAPLP